MLDLILAALLLLFLLAAAVVIAYVTYRISTYSANTAANTADANAPRAPPIIRGDDSTCSICLDTPTDPVITNCGHVYCAPCLLQTVAHLNPGTSLSCPTCRRPVTLMMPRGHIQDAAVQEQVHSFNRRYGTIASVLSPL